MALERQWLIGGRTVPLEPQFASSPLFMLLVIMLSLDTLQVEFSVRARMYALGMLIASLSTLSYLAALSHAGRYTSLLWMLWGSLTGAGLLVHHFLGFFAAAQLFVAIVFILADTKSAPIRVVRSLGCLFLGCLLAVAVYSPWLSVIHDQYSEVKEYFWIPPLSFTGVAGSFSSWLTGTAPVDWTASPVVFANILAVVSLIVGMWYRPIAAVPFVCQALIPWALCLAASGLASRSLLQERYLLFGQVSAFTAICIGWVMVDSSIWRGIVAGVLVATHVVGVAVNETPYDIREDIYGSAVGAVLEHDDGSTSRTIFVAWPANVNRARYFLEAAGKTDWQVKLISDPFRRGHLSHIGALDAGEIYWSPTEQLKEVDKGAWVISDAPGASALSHLNGVSVAESHEFLGSGSEINQVFLVRTSTAIETSQVMPTP